MELQEITRKVGLRPSELLEAKSKRRKVVAGGKNKEYMIRSRAMRAGRRKENNENCVREKRRRSRKLTKRDINNARNASFIKHGGVFCL